MINRVYLDLNKINPKTNIFLELSTLTKLC